MLCARVLKHEGENKNIVLRIFDAMFKAWLRGYEVTLDVVLKYRFSMVFVMLATLAGTVWLYIVIPKGFFPVEDTGFINATPRGRRIFPSRRCTTGSCRSRNILREDPAVRLHQFHGGRRRPESDQQLRALVRCPQAAQRAHGRTRPP